MEFDDYVRQRGAALVRLGRLLTGDRHQGEDLAQEVLARAFVRWDRIAADPPEPYLRRMLVNAAISRRRLAASREVVMAEPRDTPGRDDLGAETAERDAVWRIVRDLPPKQRAAVVLRYYEDLDDAAIAALLRCSRETVRSQVKRALDTLRARLAAAGTDAGPAGTAQARTAHGGLTLNGGKP
ncbi:SigE family RNA polymerase sigma factor [Dactylosporangium sp. CA-092794]|uniref:SigE family RNA polymerase sigma factor n=1 Tax=Dactylosporangium sp. CA-092794 TaxID=3239929 RepID=UPI003D9361FB